MFPTSPRCTRPSAIAPRRNRSGDRLLALDGADQVEIAAENTVEPSGAPSRGKIAHERRSALAIAPNDRVCGRRSGEQLSRPAIFAGRWQGPLRPGDDGDAADDPAGAVEPSVSFQHVES